MLKNEDYESILRKHGRSLGQVIPKMVCLSLYIAFDAKTILKSTEWVRTFEGIFMMISDSTLTSFYLLYDDAACNILDYQARLALSVKTSLHSDENYVFSQKWRLRRLMEKVNRLFAWPLSTFFSVLFLVILHTSARFLESNPDQWDTMLFIACELCDPIQMYALASKGSAIGAQNAKLESYLLEHTSVATFDSQIRARLLPVFRVREEWDVLQVAGFTLNLPNFLRYLGFCVSFVAVILQFDYKVVRAINDLSGKSTPP